MINRVRQMRVGFRNVINRVSPKQGGVFSKCEESEPLNEHAGLRKRVQPIPKSGGVLRICDEAVREGSCFGYVVNGEMRGNV